MFLWLAVVPAGLLSFVRPSLYSLFGSDGNRRAIERDGSEWIRQQWTEKDGEMKINTPLTRQCRMVYAVPRDRSVRRSTFCAQSSREARTAMEWRKAKEAPAANRAHLMPI